MSAQTRGIGLSVIGGLVASVLVGVALSILEIPFSTTIGAFIGGLVAAWILYGTVKRAAVAGGAVGVLSFPLELSVFVFLVGAGLYTPPPVPEIPPQTLGLVVAMSVALNIVSGAIGGVIVALARGAPPAAGVPAPSPPPPPMPPAIPRKFCVQCGAQIPAEAMVCPACGAKQPQP